MLLKGQGLTPRGIGLAVLCLFVFPNLPRIWLKRKARKRARRLELAMPDALDLLVVCVEGGLSLDGGLQQVARRTKGELSLELQRLQAEVNAGTSRRDALQAMAARSQSQSLSVFCTTMVQADKMGMSVASTLRTLVETMRTKRRQAAETQARKAPIKMLPFLVVFMIPSLFTIILGPAVLGIMEFFRSQGG
jgi:tight adherence protein C